MMNNWGIQEEFVLLKFVYQDRLDMDQRSFGPLFFLML